MIKTIENGMYQSFGLLINSEIGLPEFREINNIDTKVCSEDIQVKIADLSLLWSEFSGTNKKFITRENLVMFQVSNTATFCVKNGNCILVSPMEGADENKLRLYILGSCMGILLMQRRILPLHGSVIKIKEKAYAFIGNSGAGKSTLASAFLGRGYQLLTDDVIAVSFTDNNEPIVTPSFPQQKLWQQSLDEFGMVASNYSPLFERETKYAVPVDSNFHSEPLPLAGVFELVKTEGDHIGIQPINKLRRLRTLNSHTYRNFLIPRLGLADWHFKTTTKLSNHIDMFQIQRPTKGFTAHNIMNLVISTINQEVGVR